MHENEQQSHSLVTNEDIVHAMDAFGIVPSEQLVARVKDLCLIYEYDADTLVSMWVFFAQQKKYATDSMDFTRIEHFEREVLHRNAVSVQTEKMKAPQKKQQVSKNNSSKFETSLLFNEYGADLSDDFVLNDTAHENSEIKSDVKTENSEMKFEKAEQVDGEIFYKRVDNYYGESLETKQWMNKLNHIYEIHPFDRNFYVKNAYRFMQLNIHHCAELMHSFFNYISEAIKNNCEFDSFGNLNVESSEECYFIGRIVKENLDGKQNDKCLRFEGGPTSKRRAFLDLSQLFDYSLIPGQIVTFKSTYDFQNGLKPSEIIDETISINDFSKEELNLSEPLQLVVASGPYFPTKTDDYELLNKLLSYVKKTKPHFIILMGPFVDSKNDFILSNRDIDELFNDLMNTINFHLFGTNIKAIIVPSLRDFNHDCIFPSPPFQGNWPQLYLASNPCLLNIAGIVIAVNSVDVLFHMIRSEFSRTSGDPEPGLRMKLLCRHLLSQQSFYPLYPPDPEVNMEYQKLEYIHLPVTPHLFLLTSKLKNFAKSVDGCVFVNSESLAKGHFSRIRIECLQGHIGSIDQHVNVEILKI
ncbi:DNA polymerase alpha subunit B-like protein [Dinothrombium tinctorium]|uniref:DNA polymerase alpha subunit B n=1 Tax=Dinothrombium tinctorium TaxID=1965070 RepID=A0A3S3SNI9_9ACAR|nr:DNA polymerase alpha subunit B-like protein [Dinothrombium tinctorium]